MMKTEISIQTLLKKLTRILLMCIFGILLTTGLWAGGKQETGDTSLILGTYTIKAAGFGNLNLKVLFDGGKYYLQTDGYYSKYIFGCYDEENRWYVWDQSVNKWTEAGIAAANVLKDLKPAAGEPKPAVQNSKGENAVQNSGYETDIEILSCKGVGAAEPPGTANLDGLRIGAPLPDGGNFTGGAAARLNMVLGLYGKFGGGIIAFSRPAGWFSGEAELFSSTPALRGKPYAAKALSLLYEYFNARGAGEMFNSCAQQYYPGIDLNALSGVNAREKQEILSRLANVLADGIKQSFEQQINGKTLFSTRQAAKGVLYGNARNIYIDAYLLFCFTRNRPLFTGTINVEDTGPFEPAGFEPVSLTESLTIARNAMRYFTWGVEYTVPQAGKYHFEGGEFFHTIISNYNRTARSLTVPWSGTGESQYRGNNYWPGKTETLRDLPGVVDYSNSITTGRYETISLGDIKEYDGLLFDSPFPGGKSGYPLPYTKDGSDSPRTFAGRMAGCVRSYLDGIYWKDTNRVTTKLFSGPPQNGIGVDSIGILSGSISMMADLADGIYSRTGTRNTETRRFTPEDLERISIVIPDLSLARPGDMVVRIREDRRNGRAVDIGVVAGFRKGSAWPPAYGGDQKQPMKDILLVTALEEQGQVQLMSLGSIAGEPESFHLRRLIRLKNGASAAARYRAQEWDLLDPLPLKMKAVIRGMEEQDRQAGEKIRERWIPNTGEYLVLTDIQIDVKNSAGVVLAVTDDEGKEVIISGAADRGYDSARGTAAHGNVYNNTGNSKFEVALISESKSDVYRLGVLESDNAGSYKMTYTNSVLYAAAGANKNTGQDKFTGNRLWINEEGKLAGRYDGNGNSNSGKTFYLGIRPLSPNDAKPGDDLILEFAIRKKGTIDPLRYEGNGTVQDMRFLTDESDYIAVYDKKLLWRANLYIDEGANDWNDDHPWNAPVAGDAGPVWWASSWGRNDWNTLETGNQKSGGQVTKILPWTRWNDNRTVEKHAAYGWGSWDTVSGFNNELKAQQELIAAARKQEAEAKKKEGAKKEGEVAEKEGTGKKSIESLAWNNDSTAPGGDWNNYVFPARKAGSKPAYSDKALSGEELKKTGQHRYYVNGSTVSVPGLSTYWYKQEPDQYEYEQTKWTSGVDCSGLAHRAAVYDGSTYYVVQHSEKYGSGNFADDNGNITLLIRGAGWKVGNNPDQLSDENDRDLISRAVPGDLLVISGHVMIIHDLERPADTSQITTFSQVKIIHSTSGDPSDPAWMVQRDTWNALGDGGKKDYKLKRYK
ncbi:hypothetical protein FACS189473_3320 [Spirochaetia bacterium]|nr:hypothetical protein FACS189473_3320 [Spirochaetia bacterium]